MPPERQARARVSLDIRRLPARAPVGVYHKPSLVQLLQVDKARRYGARGQGGGGEADGFGLVDPRGLSVREPDVELGEGVGVKLGAGEGVFGVLVGLPGVRVGRGGDFGTRGAVV